ncbi:lipopolysaccharide biosynthesis protein [Allosphingosinicella sp.]|jgi:O-antigen/teichoic acid export membrane protein|uniref:lipopolysaccharide biosynthesis protein n=1 Tax=Allosphingosinicella sp. TaxID=2823234 RepID=UPI002F11E7E5
MLRAFLTHSLIYGAATIMTRGAALVLLLVLPFFLDPAEYGALALIMTVNAFALILVPLEVTQGLARYFPASPPEEAALYAGSAWWFTLTMLALMIAVGALLAGPASELLLGREGEALLIWIALPMFAGNALFYFVQAQLRWEFRPGEYFLLSLLFSAALVGLALGLASVASRPLEGVIAGQAIAALAVAGIGALLVRRTIFRRPNKEKLGDLLRFSLPLVPGGFAIYTSQYVNRFILNGYSTLADVGIFTFASQIAGIATLLTMGVQASLAPLVMAHYKEPETPTTIARAFEAFVALSLCLCLFLGLLGPDAILHFGDSDYLGAGPLILILAPASVMSGMYVFAPGFMIAKKTLWQMGVSIAGAALSVGMGFLLIPRLGALGAALATLAAAAFWLVLWFGLSQRLYPVPVRWLRLAALLPAAAAAALAGRLIEADGVWMGIALDLAFIAGLAAVAVALDLVPLGKLLRFARRPRS